MMKIFSYMLISLMLLFFTNPLAYGSTTPNKLEEAYGVDIQNMKVNLDKRSFNIGVKVKWHYKQADTQIDYIDSNLIIKDIKTFLTNYPHKNDYWEVINHNLTIALIAKYPQLSSLRIKLEISQTKEDPYAHFSEVVAKGRY